MIEVYNIIISHNPMTWCSQPDMVESESDSLNNKLSEISQVLRCMDLVIYPTKLGEVSQPKLSGLSWLWGVRHGSERACRGALTCCQQP